MFKIDKILSGKSKVAGIKDGAFVALKQKPVNSSTHISNNSEMCVCVRACVCACVRACVCGGNEHVFQASAMSSLVQCVLVPELAQQTAMSCRESISLRMQQCDNYSALLL